MRYFNFIFCLSFLISCSKSGFLDFNPNPSQAVPTTLSDYQAILDNDVSMNGEGSTGLVPCLGEIGSDDYYDSETYFNTYLSPLYQRTYTWAKDVFKNEQIYDWNIAYQSIDRANVVLDGLAALHVTADEQTAYNVAKGSALFYRSHLFYQLAQIFASPYVADSANVMNGVALRLTSSLTEAVTRVSLQASYDTIVGELKAAAMLLPSKRDFQTQPSKAACFGLLARVYLTMNDYSNALTYSDSCLALANTLMDYNSFEPSASYPFSYFNAEIIFQCELRKGPDYLLPTNLYSCYVDNDLYKQYDDSDLRKNLFFYFSAGGFQFKGSYSGSNATFAGITTDEMYLVKAECEARKGSNDAALNDLNTLLKKRYKAGAFAVHNISNTPNVLETIINERRKELCFRGLRWIDLRRLNTQGSNITLARVINGTTYTLYPNDSRYVYPIPEPVLSLNPNIQQNNR